MDAPQKRLLNPRTWSLSTPWPLCLLQTFQLARGWLETRYLDHSGFSLVYLQLKFAFPRRTLDDFHTGH